MLKLSEARAGRSWALQGMQADAEGWGRQLYILHLCIFFPFFLSFWASKCGILILYHLVHPYFLIFPKYVMPCCFITALRGYTWLSAVFFCTWISVVLLIERITLGEHSYQVNGKHEFLNVRNMRLILYVFSGLLFLFLYLAAPILQLPPMK